MPEVASAFSSPELRCELANCLTEPLNRSLGSLAQITLELAVETLPPRGFAVALPVSCQRCSHLTPDGGWPGLLELFKTEAERA
jgi:hypothetical protein